MEQAAPSARIFRFGLFEADVARAHLNRNGMRIKIQDQPFRVLVFLLERPGEIVSREELRQKLWPDGTFVDFDGSLNVILKKLRAAIDDDSDNPRFIETVPRRGYRFIAPVTLVGGSAPTTSEAATPSPSAAVLGASTSKPYPLYIGVAVLVLVAGSFGLYKWRDNRSSNPSNNASAATPAVAMRKSVAVLGFSNTSGQPSDAWMSTALAEMLSTELGGGEKLRLVSGEDVANLRLSSPWSQTGSLDQATTSRIGVALNTDLLVLGSFTTVGKPERGQLRVDARLQDARTGEILTEIAEIGATEDLFRMVSRIGGKLRDRIGVPRMEDAEEVSAIAALPANPEASRFYSLGLAKLREYDYGAAQGLFKQAIAAEPKFPLAHSMLSRADIFLGYDEQAKSEAKRGLDLAEKLSRVQKMEVEASYYHAIADRGKAAEIYKVLFDLFPDSIDYGLQLAKLQTESYHTDEALETLRKLRQLPAPARDHPGIDLREGFIQLRKNPEAADKLYHSAAEKALAQGKKLIYAKAEENICSMNRQRLASPPECQQAYETFLGAGNRNEAAATLQIMAETQRLTGHEPEAIPLYEQAIRVHKEVGNHESIGVALNNLALIYEDQGQWARAEAAYRDAQQNFRSVNDRINTFITIANIADIVVMRGKLQKAEAMYRESWELADTAKTAHDEYAHIQHASLLLLQGKAEEAKTEIHSQIDSLRSWGGDPYMLATALSVLGDIQKAAGELDAARKNYEEGLELLKKANAPTGTLQQSVADIWVLQGNTANAETTLREVIKKFEIDKNKGEELAGYQSLCRALLAQGKLKESGEAISQAAHLLDLQEFPVMSLPVELLQARVRAASAISTGADLTLAERDLRSIAQRASQIGDYLVEVEAKVALGELEMRTTPKVGRVHLTSLVRDARDHGFALYAKQAEATLAKPADLAQTRVTP